jgi:uncharacterized membrane protein
MDRIMIKQRAKEAIRNNFVEIGVIYLIIAIVKGIIPNGGSGVNTSWTQQVYNFDGWENVVVQAPKGLGFIGQVLSWFVMGVVFLVYVHIATKRNNDERVDVGDFLVFTKGRWLDFGILGIIKNVFIMLWTFLLVIPGIIKAYSYAMSEYIYNDNEELNYTQAITESRQLMNGHKLELFILDLSFVGWYILGIFTLGILWLWVAPYHFQSRYNFYLELKNY